VVPEALKFFRQLGPVRTRSHNHRLVTQKAKELSKTWNTPVDGPPGLHGSMMAVRLPDRFQRRDPRQLMAEWIERRRFIVPVMPVDGVLWARVSAQVYNAPQDYDRLLRVTCSTP
jgi:isopenicillin-N epimerase